MYLSHKYSLLSQKLGLRGNQTRTTQWDWRGDQNHSAVCAIKI